MRLQHAGFLTRLQREQNDNPLWAVITSGFNADKANQELIDGLKHLSNEQLLEKWASTVKPRGLVSFLLPDAYLADDWVHNQDVRWPLNRPSKTRPVMEIVSLA
jgi:hypothetical protein